MRKQRSPSTVVIRRLLLIAVTAGAIGAPWLFTRGSGAVDGALLSAHAEQVVSEIGSGDSGMMSSSPLSTIDFEAYSIDLGAMTPYAGIVAAEFSWTNTGQTPVKLRELRSSCGCSRAVWQASWVEPGGTSTCSVEFFPDRRRGPVDLKATAFFEPGPDQVFLTVTADVSESIEVEPAPVELGRFDSTTVTHASVVIRNRGDAPVSIRMLKEASSTVVSAHLESDDLVLPPGAETFLDIVCPPLSGWSQLDERLVLRLSDPLSNIVIPVRGAPITVPALVVPRVVNFGVLRSGREAARVVRVLGSEGADVRVLGVACDTLPLEYSTGPIEGGQQVTLTVDGKRGGAAGEISAVVRLTVVAGGREGELELPVRALFVRNEEEQ